MLTATAARVVVAVADRREVAVPLGALASSQFRVQDEGKGWGGGGKHQPE
jgi:hypothetical protein